MDHRNILAQQFDGLGKHFLAAIHILHVQQVDRVEQNLQVRAADLVQHGAGALGVIHDVLDHRLDGNGHAVLFGAAHHRLEVLDKSGKSSITAALRAELVLGVGRTGLGAHHAAAQKACKADMGVIFFLNGVQGVRIRVGKVQVVAQHRNVDAILLELVPQIQRIAGCQGTGRVGHLFQGLAQGHVGAGEALLAHQRQHLFQRQLFGVVQTQAELDHENVLLFPQGGDVGSIIHQNVPAEKRRPLPRPQFSLLCGAGKPCQPRTLRVRIRCYLLKFFAGEGKRCIVP